MSFQDVGKRGPSTQQGGWSSQTASERAAPSFRGGDPFRQLSDGILQYQRNVGILEKIVRQIGSKNDGPELQMQYDVQVDVLKQLGSKLEAQLKEQEADLATVPRDQAARRRATQIKLSRDYQRVEVTFKNLVLETRRKRARVNESKKQALSGSSTTDDAMEEERIELELQLQQDRLNEEIMREREAEIRSINRGMHQVNEIYKDLAHIVESQQEQVDQIEDQMEQSKVNAERGLQHIHKANEKAAAGQCIIS
mmetsp:Transcript_19963/g.34099  ORF Transcript_19963/g.34099 Transcript_19963/m.34099 type:complete len:253 (-) Transcript_19963:191-949(-)|eukprot:CAMPEP_0116567566 /NCGR_PEP_ID=MMETSP0397-20121206/15080_1 /TAXON_ID=216820 /ORGANISM="Cyclophora tenuis, Strain ECT3854" /LENGTH=252 /DNA_ID=CAMNT_0004094575 /DNA_START=73 /DNA_END=831 /DNA_ORIENTATION=+